MRRTEEIELFERLARLETQMKILGIGIITLISLTTSLVYILIR
jgi:hypothetical protein